MQRVRRRLFNLASLLSLLLCVLTVCAFVLSFITPIGISKDWVKEFRNSSDAYHNGLHRGMPGQGTRLIILTHGVLYDRSYASGNPYIDPHKLVLREHKWWPDTSGNLAETTLGFSWDELYWQSAGYSYERQVSVPLLFIALVTALLPSTKYLTSRRPPGCLR